MVGAYTKVLMLMLCIFSIAGISSGLIIYAELPKTLQEATTIRNSYVVMIISISFVALFSAVYLGFEILHEHKELDIKDSTKMYYYNPRGKY